MSRDTYLSFNISESGVTREMPKVSAVAMLKDAQDFLKAAKVLAEQNVEREAILIDFFSPLYFLICHSMELSLKAYLRARGYDDTALRKLGHGLKRCCREAEKQELVVTEDFRIAVNWLDGYHLDHAFRYHAERYLRVPLPSPLLGLVEPQISAVGTEVHRIVREHLRRASG